MTHPYLPVILYALGSHSSVHESTIIKAVLVFIRNKKLHGSKY